VSVHAVVVDPPDMPARDADALRALVAMYGGAFVELAADASLDGAASWLDRAWHDAATGAELRAGDGVTRVDVAKDARAAEATLRRAGTSAHVIAKDAAAVPVAQLALALAEPSIRERLGARHVAVDDARSLLVKSARASKRSPTVARLVADDDVDEIGDVMGDRSGAMLNARTVSVAGTIDRAAVQRMFDVQLGGRARACYERALARSPHLEGRVVVTVELARGEVAWARVEGSAAEAALQTCLVDAAYGMTPPLAAANDERVIATYPLELKVSGEKGVVIEGDADSESPIDFEAVGKGCRGDACFRKNAPKPPDHIDPGDTKTPLGGMRP